MKKSIGSTSVHPATLLERWAIFPDLCSSVPLRPCVAAQVADVIGLLCELREFQQAPGTHPKVAQNTTMKGFPS